LLVAGSNLPPRARLNHLQDAAIGAADPVAVLEPSTIIVGFCIVCECYSGPVTQVMFTLTTTWSGEVETYVTARLMVMAHGDGGS
jgi:hypothetical protein